MATSVCLVPSGDFRIDGRERAARRRAEDLCSMIYGGDKTETFRARGIGR